MKARPHSIRARFDDELSCSGPDAVEVWTAPELFQRVAPVHLSTLPESDGLRLMAFANILGGDVTWPLGGDLTRSAANALSLKRWTAFATPEVTPLLVTNLWMDEVVHDLKAAMAGLADFLVSSLRRDAGHQGERRRLAEALVERLGSALVTAQTTDYREMSNGSHVTGNTKNIDAEARKVRLATSLYNDALLGPVYRTWSHIFRAADRA